MSAAILVLNAGSSSLKFALFEAAGAEPAEILSGQIEGIGRRPRFIIASGTATHSTATHTPAAPAGLATIADHDGAIDLLLDWLADAAEGAEVIAAGHRVVHGGARFTEAVRITPEVLAALTELAPLAPHHQPHNLTAIRALAARQPKLAQVACFDTAFHASQPEVATTLALPAELRAKGLRGYGFHGLSYEYIAGALPALYQARGLTPPGKVVAAHLGNGASLCAMQDGESRATTMGFSTLDGLVMGSRSGALDPGVILYLLREEGLNLEQLTELLYNRAGLLGLSGISADMRELLASEAPGAKLAVRVFCYRLKREIGSLAAALGGLDALVFTGGIGARATAIRAEVCRGAAWLGVELDPAANDAGGPCITTAASRVQAWVMPTNEELVIARHTAALLT